MNRDENSLEKIEHKSERTSIRIHVFFLHADKTVIIFPSLLSLGPSSFIRQPLKYYPGYFGSIHLSSFRPYGTGKRCTRHVEIRVFFTRS
jgi:hypothetical protein